MVLITIKTTVITLITALITPKTTLITLKTTVIAQKKKKTLEETVRPTVLKQVLFL